MVFRCHYSVRAQMIKNLLGRKCSPGMIDYLCPGLWQAVMDKGPLINRQSVELGEYAENRLIVSVGNEFWIVGQALGVLII